MVFLEGPRGFQSHHIQYFEFSSAYPSEKQVLDAPQCEWAFEGGFGRDNLAIL